VQAARAQVAQADAGHWFTVDLVASDALSRQGPTAAVDGSSSTHTTSVGVQLNVPIFSGGSVSAKQREAAAQLAKAEADLDATRLQVRSDLGAAWVSLQAAQAHGDAAGLRVQALSAQADALRKRWDRGVAAEAEVRAAQQDEAQARADWLRLQGESVQAYVRLLALTGRGLTPRSSPPG
jgi:outer membrane protein TolC